MCALVIAAVAGCSSGESPSTTIARTTANALDAAGYRDARVLPPATGDEVIRISVASRTVPTTAPDIFAGGSGSTLPSPAAIAATRGAAPSESPVTFVPGGPAVPRAIAARAGEIDAVAEIVWDSAPVRFDALELVVTDLPLRQYARAELEQRFGPRPASLVERDPPSPPGTSWTARLVLLGVVLAATAAIIRSRIVQRRRRARLLATRDVLLPPKLGAGG
jgi:hypothetical protein